MADPRIAAVLTTGRQDYGILRSTLLCLRNDPSFELRLLVSRPEHAERVIQMGEDTPPRKHFCDLQLQCARN